MKNETQGMVGDSPHVVQGGVRLYAQNSGFSQQLPSWFPGGTQEFYIHCGAVGSWKPQKLMKREASLLPLFLLRQRDLARPLAGQGDVVQTFCPAD